MKNFNLVVNSYVGLIACAVGFSISQYLAEGSVPILLFATLLSVGVVIFGNSEGKDKANPIELVALAVISIALGWSFGQGLWGT